MRPRHRLLTVAGGGLGSLVLAAAPAAAHTGRPVRGLVDGLAHPVLGPDHLAAMVAVGVLAAATAGGRPVWWAPLGFVTGMVGGALVGMATGAVGAVETGIVASVIALGGLIAAGRPTRGWWLPALVAALGALHGHAHGAELPDGAWPVAYLAGFVAATAALHLTGTLLGLALRRTAEARIATGVLVGAFGVALLGGIA